MVIESENRMSSYLKEKMMNMAIELQVALENTSILERYALYDEGIKSRQRM